METIMTENERKLRYVIEKHRDTVYKVAYSYCKNSSDSDDIFQEVFLRFLKNKPNFNDEEHEKAWFIRVTINCCKTFLASFWRTKVVELDDQISFENKEEGDLFYTVLDLPKKYRIVIHLYYYEDYSIKEISKILDIKETTIQTQLQRARELIKKKLVEGGGEREQAFVQKSIFKSGY